MFIATFPHPLDVNELEEFNLGLRGFHRLCILEHVSDMTWLKEAKVNEERLFEAFHKVLDYLMITYQNSKKELKDCVKRHIEQGHKEVCGPCVSFFVESVLKKDGFACDYIHPRIWETGDINLPACNADVVARAAWYLLRRQLCSCFDASEYLRRVFDMMRISEKLMVNLGGKMDFVYRVHKRAKSKLLQ